MANDVDESLGSPEEAPRSDIAPEFEATRPEPVFAEGEPSASSGVGSAIQVDSSAEQPPAPKPRRRRRTAKKALEEAERSQRESAQGFEGTTAEEAPGEAEDGVKTHRRRRTRRVAEEDSDRVAPDAGDGVSAEGGSAEEAQKPKARRGRKPRARRAEEEANGDALGSSHAEEGSPSAEESPAHEVASGESSQEEQAGPKANAGEASEGQSRENRDQANGRRRRHNNHERVHENGKNNSNSYNQRNEGHDSRYEGRNNNGRYGYQNNRNNRGNNRRNNRNEQSVEPSLTMDELRTMKVAELRNKAAELDIEYLGLRKAQLVEAVYHAAAEAEGFRSVDGILDIQSEGYGFLRTGNYMKGDNDAFVHQQLIRQYGLRPGDRVQGTTAPGRSNNKFPPLGRVEAINGMPPEQAKHRPRFRDLTPIYPNERLVMENGKDSITGRAIDLVAPIGKGQRGLIVSPPKAGKTTVLKHICQSIAANNPEVHLFCLLVDERPEEVTDMERSIHGTVVASTFDMPASNHTAVAELVIEHAKRLVEMGEDVVVVLDSITRLARAYNLAAPASGRILSGGVDSAALYPPKKFLGAARNIENGGSLTILASALVDTGSKMDEVIFEEFKGTGNMELKLDRELADKRIFPAIDPVASGTRNEELLLDPELTPLIWGIRRVLANMNNVDRSATALVKGLRATSSNEEFLIRSAKKAQQQEYIA